MPASSSRLDLVAASTATGMKVLSWAVAAAVVYRQLGEAAFAVLAMTRATLGLLNYTTFGLGPALTKLVAEAERAPNNEDSSLSDKKPNPVSRGSTSRRSGGNDDLPATDPDLRLVEPRLAEDVDSQTRRAPILDYRGRRRYWPPLNATRIPYHQRGSPASLLTTTNSLLVVMVIAVSVALFLYSTMYSTVHAVPGRVPDGIAFLVIFLGLGLFLRLMADAVGGASHALGHVAHDQSFSAAADLLWIVLLAAPLFYASGMNLGLGWVGGTFFISGLAAYLGRLQFASHVTGWSNRRHATPADRTAQKKLLTYGGLVTLGSAADFLYAPIDYFILNRLVDPLAPAVYAPAVQIDAAILVLVSAVATVALPSAARLAAAGDMAGVWRGYLRGSLLAGGIAMAIALPAWLLSPWVYTLWLGDDLPATRAILPLVLVHTVLGSAAGVGRATLVAVGQAKSYAVVVLVGGLVNVGLSLLFVKLGLGINGVVLGTVLSVGLRCLVVLPILVRVATR